MLLSSLFTYSYSSLPLFFQDIKITLPSLALQNELVCCFFGSVEAYDDLLAMHPGKNVKIALRRTEGPVDGCIAFHVDGGYATFCFLFSLVHMFFFCTLQTYMVMSFSSVTSSLLSLSVSVCLCLSLSLSVSVSFCVFLCLSVSVTFCLFCLFLLSQVRHINCAVHPER